MKIFNDAAVSWALVLTKMDKLKVAEQEKVIASAKEISRHVAAWPGVFAIVGKGEGIAALRAHITALARP